MTTTDTWQGKAVLTFAHTAGMVDLVALPLWIGALMQYYGFSPAQAGLTVTIFLLGVVAASMCFAPRFNRLPRRAAVTAGFTLAALAFGGASVQPAGAASLPLLAALHLLAGLGVGCALSFTHGCIGRSANPHRLFATVSAVMGGFAVIFLASVPQLMQRNGGQALFIVFASGMAVAAAVTCVGFPALGTAGPDAPRSAGEAHARIPRIAWIVIAVVVCLTLNQAMVFSFVERIGEARGFGTERVQAVLVALGLVNLVPGVLAALLQKRWSASAVGMAGPACQALLALVISSATVFAAYAVATSLYVFMVIFTHTFLFGLLARLDRSGRAVAATPAMMMVGSCIGPALGGGLVQTLGYPALGWAACVVGLVAVLCMQQVRRQLSAAPVVTRPLAA